MDETNDLHLPSIASSFNSFKSRDFSSYSKELTFMDILVLVLRKQT